MRCLVLVVPAVVLAAPASAQTLKLDFSSRLSDPTGATPCRRFGSVVDDFFCAPPLFLVPPVPAPFVTFSWIRTMYEWVYKDGRRMRREEPDRKGNLQPIIFNFNTQTNGTTRYGVLDWQLRFDEGSADHYTYWLTFSSTWNKVFQDNMRVGIAAITRVDESTWVTRPIDPRKGDPLLPQGVQPFQALLTQHVLANEGSCAAGTGGSCYLGDYLLPFELTLKKLPKVR